MSDDGPEPPINRGEEEIRSSPTVVRITAQCLNQVSRPIRSQRLSPQRVPYLRTVVPFVPSTAAVGSGTDEVAVVRRFLEDACVLRSDEPMMTRTDMLYFVKGRMPELVGDGPGPSLNKNCFFDVWVELPSPTCFVLLLYIYICFSFSWIRFCYGTIVHLVDGHGHRVTCSSTYIYFFVRGCLVKLLDGFDLPQGRIFLRKRLLSDA